MSRLTSCIVFSLLILTVFCQQAKKSDDLVNISGQFNVFGENEEVSDNSGNVIESPLFELPSMKIAREYLRRQIQKEKANQKNE